MASSVDPDGGVVMDRGDVEVFNVVDADNGTDIELSCLVHVFEPVGVLSLEEIISFWVYVFPFQF